jgi:MFS family permease
MANDTTPAEQKSPLREIIQPFIDLSHAPRALWGINLAYVIEGMCYFGMLMYLAMYFNEYVGLSDQHAAWMVGTLTAGITIAMFFLGGVADKWGVRFALLAAFIVMLGGRALLACAPYLGLAGTGLWSPVHLMAMAGILLVVIGYGMYQPGAYAGVRQFTTKKTAAMGYAMLYALMNLGGWLPTWFTPIRQKVGISGAYWVFVGFTAVALVLTFLILSRKTVERAIASAKAEREREESEKAQEATGKEASPKEATLPTAFPVAQAPVGFWKKAGKWIVDHPMANPKFAFFIFCLIPVQTLFAHNWLTLPMYIERGFRESWPWISVNFEKAVNFNPLLIFILVPIVTAVSQKRKVYNMMILGTFIMAAPTFLLALGAKPWTLVAYLIIMTVGEAMWQPRFLQYAAEIAPEGRTGAYMGVAQFPWFLTKVIVPLYSGWFLARYCPEEGPAHTETMWLIYAGIAMFSTVMLILAKGWLGKDFKTKAD